MRRRHLRSASLGRSGISANVSVIIAPHGLGALLKAKAQRMRLFWLMDMMRPRVCPLVGGALPGRRMTAPLAYSTTTAGAVAGLPRSLYVRVAVRIWPIDKQATGDFRLLSRAWEPPAGPEICEAPRGGKRRGAVHTPAPLLLPRKSANLVKIGGQCLSFVFVFLSSAFFSRPKQIVPRGTITPAHRDSPNRPC